MVRTADELIQEVLSLPDDERERVLVALLDELSASAPEEDTAFVAELRRRADDALSGKSEGIPWRDVIGELRSELQDRRARRKSA